jgi:hypothetical protein
VPVQDVQGVEKGPEIPTLREGNLPGDMIMARRKKKARRKGGRCGCPPTAVKVSTKGRGQGFVCLRKQPKAVKRHGLTYVSHPFVKTVCR